jgi:glyceraldehyde-3-phosphate dehydrogenase type II
MDETKKKIVHVVGTGTIGEPLIGLLAEKRNELGIDEVTYHKRTPLKHDRSKVHALSRKGAKLCVEESARKDFLALGMEPEFEMHEAFERASVVIDCTPSGIGINNKNEFYEKYKHNTLGFIAQGSEFGFGKMYARGINDETLLLAEDKFIQVVSCNTHNLAVVLKILALDGQSPDNLESARFVCFRRANDISQDTSYVPAPQVGSHKDKEFGTHHARDAYYLYKTKGFELDLFSSALVMNSQYMHILHFNLRVRKKTTVSDLIDKLKADRRVAITEKKSANQVFSFGRDQGYYGRIMNQTVVPISTLAVHNGGHEIVGFCFTPQDGNSLLSSIAATEWFLYPKQVDEKLQFLMPYFFDEV